MQNLPHFLFPINFLFNQAATKNPNSIKIGCHQKECNTILCWNCGFPLTVCNWCYLSLCFLQQFKIFWCSAGSAKKKKKIPRCSCEFSAAPWGDLAHHLGTMGLRTLLAAISGSSQRAAEFSPIDWGRGNQLHLCSLPATVLLLSCAQEVFLKLLFLLSVLSRLWLFTWH